VLAYGQTGTGKTYTMFGETTNGKVEMAVPGEVRSPKRAAQARAEADARDGSVKAAAGSVGAGQAAKTERDAHAMAATKLGGRRGSVVALRMGLLPRLAEGIFQFFAMPGVDAAAMHLTVDVVEVSLAGGGEKLVDLLADAKAAKRFANNKMPIHEDAGSVSIKGQTERKVNSAAALVEVAAEALGKRGECGHVILNINLTRTFPPVVAQAHALSPTQRRHKQRGRDGGDESPKSPISPGKTVKKKGSSKTVQRPPQLSRFTLVDLAGPESVANVRLRRGSTVEGRWDAQELRAAGPARVENLKAIERSLAALHRVIGAVVRNNQRRKPQGTKKPPPKDFEGSGGGAPKIKITGGAVAAATAVEVEEEEEEEKALADELVPYRESKLTHLLKPVLNGSARAAMLCCVSPLARNTNTTRYTLRFARTVARLTLGARRERHRR